MDSKELWRQGADMQKILIALLISLWPSSLLVANPYLGMMSAGVAVSDGVLLIGNNTDYSAGSDGGQGSGTGTIVWAQNGADFTAVNSGVLRNGYLRLGSVATATAFRMGVFVLSSGTTYNLVEWSNEVTVSENILAHVTFSGTYSSVAGSHYVLCYIANGYMYTRRGGNTWTHHELSGGSYASPPSTLNIASGSGAAFAEMEIYVTN